MKAPTASHRAALGCLYVTETLIFGAGLLAKISMHQVPVTTFHLTTRVVGDLSEIRRHLCDFLSPTNHRVDVQVPAVRNSVEPTFVALGAKSLMPVRRVPRRKKKTRSPMLTALW
jgi:hypothetical protein